MENLEFCFSFNVIVVIGRRLCPGQVFEVFMGVFSFVLMRLIMAMAMAMAMVVVVLVVVNMLMLREDSYMKSDNFDILFTPWPPNSDM